MIQEGQKVSSGDLVGWIDDTILNLKILRTKIEDEASPGDLKVFEQGIWFVNASLKLLFEDLVDFDHKLTDPGDD